jgi:hypothetical protein
MKIKKIIIKKIMKAYLEQKILVFTEQMVHFYIHIIHNSN